MNCEQIHSYPKDDNKMVCEEEAPSSIIEVALAIVEKPQPPPLLPSLKEKVKKLSIPSFFSFIQKKADEKNKEAVDIVDFFSEEGIIVKEATNSELKEEEFLSSLFRMAFLYETGILCGKNSIETAKNLYAFTAKWGLHEAEYNFGCMLEDGHLVKKDLEKARIFFRLATKDDRFDTKAAIARVTKKIDEKKNTMIVD